MPLNKPDLFNSSKLSKEEFLSHYWHKKPFLFKKAFKQHELDFLPNKEELTKLSEREDIQSRVVIKNTDVDYDVEIGPFESGDFKNLNAYTWNLLVSDIDKWLPKSSKILTYFDFIRNWIFDDIMISTGSIGGTVGAHTDHYDVFLLQTHGQRQWQFGHNKIYDPELIDDASLKLLSAFKPDESYILNPGDVLYIPPEVAHYGVIKSPDCVSVSIGMRTPSHSELLTNFIDTIASKLSDNKRFEEPAFSKPPLVGEITQQDLEQVKNILIENINTTNINQWFGQYVSSYRTLFHEFSQTNESCDLTRSQGFNLNSFSKACYLKEAQQTTLFINGDNYSCSYYFAQLLCNDKHLSSQQIACLDEKDKLVLVKLVRNGAIN